MRRIAFWAVIYCIVHTAAGDVAVSFEGMSPDAVAQAIAQTYGAKFDVVDKPSHDALVANSRAKHLGPFVPPTAPPAK